MTNNRKLQINIKIQDMLEKNSDFLCNLKLLVMLLDKKQEEMLPTSEVIDMIVAIGHNAIVIGDLIKDIVGLGIQEGIFQDS